MIWTTEVWANSRTKKPEMKKTGLYWDTQILLLVILENKKYIAYDRFHRNGPFGEIPTKKEPIRIVTL